MILRDWQEREAADRAFYPRVWFRGEWLYCAPLQNRFEANVICSPDCWLWRGGHRANGYAVFSLGKQGKTSRVIRASRVAYALENVVEVRAGDQINHHCDNPGCVRPSHLYLGTQKENTQDAIRRGRFKFLTARPGAANSAAKLTQAQVDEIRRVYAARTGRNWGGCLLAKTLGVDRSTISLIIGGKTWV